MSDAPSYTAEQVDAAVAVLADPERLRHAQDVVTHAAPALQRMLGLAMEDGGYFTGAHDEAVTRMARIEDPQERLTALRTLVAEEARLGMLVGAAVGFELARELQGRFPDGAGKLATDSTDGHAGSAPVTVREPGEKDTP